MIPLRADVHRLWMSARLALVFMYVLKCPASTGFYPSRTEQDMNCVISFSKGRADLASCHLMVDHLPQQLRPLPALLTDHLSQGVYLWCLFPESQRANRQHANDLESVAEGFETPLSPKDDGDIVDLAHYVSTRLTLKTDLSGRPVLGGKKEALDALHQYDEISHGPGKATFEKYSEVALTVVGY
jgi:hypothetical protein